MKQIDLSGTVKPIGRARTERRDFRDLPCLTTHVQNYREEKSVSRFMRDILLGSHNPMKSRTHDKNTSMLKYCFRCPPQLWEEIEKYASIQGKKKSEFIRDVIHAGSFNPIMLWQEHTTLHE